MSRVLVTGASGGIGAAICHELADQGASVILHFNSDRGKAEDVKDSLQGRHEIVQADLNDPAQCEDLWQAACAWGPVDAIVNNAGIFPPHPPLSSGYEVWCEAWQKTLAVNLIAPVHLTYFATRSMARHGGGRIVNISSRGAFRGEPDMPAYAASKAGLNAFSQSMAKALASRSVYLFVVAPGWVATPSVAGYVQDSAVLADLPLGRVATAKEVAQVVAYCALHAPPSMTGAILDVNGASYLRS